MSNNKYGKVVKKAYGINWSYIEEGEYYQGNIEPVYASSRNEAKTLLLPESSDYKSRWTHGYITYMTLPVVRYKNYDKYEFKGKELTIAQIEKEEFDAKRLIELESILNNKLISYCYINKRGSYYRPNSCGYTDRRDRAGIYTKEEAVSDAMSCKELDIIPIDNEEHNEMIKKQVNELNSRLIQFTV